jgi:hypothetical protein
MVEKLNILDFIAKKKVLDFLQAQPRPNNLEKKNQFVS